MISLPIPSDSQLALPERIGAKVTIAHIITTAIITIMAIGAYVTLERVVAVGHATAASIGTLERQRSSSQRVASLAAQYALGNAAARGGLPAAVDDFETSHWRAIAGDRAAGIPSVIADPALKARYFDGVTPLDATATVFISRARHIAALAPRNASLRAQSAALFAVANGPLLEELDAVQRLRTQRSESALKKLRLTALAACALAILALMASTLTVFRVMAQHILTLTCKALELSRLATVDPLTGLLNRRSFHARGAIEIQKARRYGRPLSVLRIDADQLAAIEDSHGRDGSETLLRALTSSIFDGTRVSDLVARVDTEQFAILLPETSCEGAELLAERLRRKVNELTISIDDKLVPCTISVGVAAAEKGEAFLGPTFARADDAVYQAKARGRNRVVVAA